MRLRRGGNNTQKDGTKKGLKDLDKHDGVVTHLEPDILKGKVNWVSESIMGFPCSSSACN